MANPLYSYKFQYGTQVLECNSLKLFAKKMNVNYYGLRQAMERNYSFYGLTYIGKTQLRERNRKKDL